MDTTWISDTRRAAAAAKDRMPGLDGLRVWAAAMVFLLHLNWFGADVWKGFIGELFWLYEAGYSAVNMFFVLSAFLLTLRWLKDPDYTRYMKRRLARIVPAYYVCVAFIFLLVYLKDVAAGKLWVIELWKHLLFVPGMTSPPGFGINPVFWSLSVEMFGYLLLPFIIKFLFTVRLWYSLAVMLIIPIAWKLLLAFGAWNLESHVTTLSYLWYALPSFLFDFAVGVVAAKYVLEGGVLPEKINNPWMPIGLLMLLASFTPESGSMRLEVAPFVSVLCAWAVLAATRHRGFSLWSTRPPVRWLADISYSFYLWHAFVVYAVVSLGKDNFVVTISASLFLSLLAAWASHRWVEPLGRYLLPSQKATKNAVKNQQKTVGV